MKIYWLILWTVLTVLTVLWNNLSDGVSVELNNSASVQSGMSENISQTKRNWQITHLGFSEESYVQNVVNYAYKLWGMDFVLHSCVQLFVTPLTAACQASLSITNS